MKNKQIIGVLALTAALTFTSLVHPYRISAAEGDTKEVAAEEEMTKGAGRTVKHYDIREDKGQFSADRYGKYHYTLEDGTIVKDAFFCDGTYTYYLQADGTPMKGRLTYHPDGKHVIYFDSYGHEVFNNFVNVTRSISGDAVDDVCYFDTFGYMYVDVITYDKEGKNLYYLNPYGVMQNGGWFQFPDGRVGYARKDGTLLTNQYGCDSNGNLAYVGADGKISLSPIDRNIFSQERQYEYRVIELVNEERRKNGVVPLQIDENLLCAAEVRANEISTKFSHTRPDGRDCFSVLEDRNINCYWCCGENIAAGYRTPDHVMNGWMNSSGHRSNILDSDYTFIGVGAYNDGKYNWVQLFGGN